MDASSPSCSKKSVSRDKKKQESQKTRHMKVPERGSRSLENSPRPPRVQLRQSTSVGEDTRSGSLPLQRPSSLGLGGAGSPALASTSPLLSPTSPTSPALPKATLSHQSRSQSSSTGPSIEPFSSSHSIVKSKSAEFVRGRSATCPPLTPQRSHLTSQRGKQSTPDSFDNWKMSAKHAVSGRMLTNLPTISRANYNIA